MIERQKTPNPAELISSIKTECEEVVRFVNQQLKKELKIIWKRGAGWYWDFEKSEVVMDLDDAEQMPADVCIGRALHEATHVFITQPDHFSSIWDEIGGAIGVNWAEDCRVENTADLVLANGKHYTQAQLAEALSDGGGLDLAVASKIKEKLGYFPQHMLLGGAMRHYFYRKSVERSLLNEGGEVDQKKYQDFLETIENQAGVEVRQRLERIIPHLEEFYQSIPREIYPTEAEITRLAKKSANIYIDSIWPIYRELVESAIEEQQLKDFFDSLPEELKKQIAKSLDDAQQTDDSSGNGEPSSAGGQSGAEAGEQSSAGGEQSGAGSQAQKNKQPSPNEQTGVGGQSEDEQKTGAGGQSGSSSDSGADSSLEDGKSEKSSGLQSGNEQQNLESSSQAGQASWDKLTPEQKELVKEEFEKLSAEQQAQYQQQAQSSLAELEDEINEQLQAKSEAVKKQTQLAEKHPSKKQAGKDQDAKSAENPSSADSQQKDEDQTSDSQANQAGSHGSGSGSGSADGEKNGQESDDGNDGHEAQATDQSPTDDQQQEQKRQMTAKEIAEYIEQLNAFDREASHEKPLGNKSSYDDFRRDQHLTDLIDELYDRLGPIFKPDDFPKKYLRETGDDIDEDAFLERMFDKRIMEVFIEEDKPEEKSIRFIIVVDISSSMSGSIVEVFKLLFILTELFTRLGVEFCVIAYPQTDSQNNKLAVSKIYKDFEETQPDMFYLPTDVGTRLTRIMTDVNGTTPTGNALSDATAILAEQEQRGQEYQKKHNFILLLTDGQPDEGVENTKMHIDALENWLSENNIQAIFTGFGIGNTSVHKMFKSMPEDLKMAIAQRIVDYHYNHNMHREINQETIGLDYLLIEELAEVFDLIIEAMLQYPEDFLQADD